MQLARLTPLPSFAPSYWRLWNPATRWVGTNLLGFAAPAVWHDSGGRPVQLVSGDRPDGGCGLHRSDVDTAVATHPGVGTPWAGAPHWAAVLPRSDLLEYGAAKVINTQFPSPRLSVLVTPFGNLQPEQLLWAFMGASPVYTFFAGPHGIGSRHFALLPPDCDGRCTPRWGRVNECPHVEHWLRCPCQAFPIAFARSCGMGGTTWRRTPVRRLSQIHSCNDGPGIRRGPERFQEFC